jgi:hypothetical protein
VWWDKAHNIDRDWLGIATLLAVGCVVAVIGYFADRRRERRLNERFEEIRNPTPSEGKLTTLASGKPPSKLVIHDAVWGPKWPAGTPGILDVNVTEILQDLARDGLVVLASNNLIGDPAPNMRKRLRVEYSYGNSNRLTVEREEDGILVLPEDPYLKKVEMLFSPLQIEILRLSRDLRQMLKDAGPAPELRNAGFMMKGDDTSTWMEAYSQWARRIIYRYRGEFASRVKTVMISLGQTTGMVVATLEPYTKDARPGYDFQQLLDLLLGFVAKLEVSDEERKSISALKTHDEDIIRRYERLLLDEQRQVLRDSPRKSFIDKIYERGYVGRINPMGSGEDEGSGEV